jgi:hypothetical protein
MPSSQRPANAQVQKEIENAGANTGPARLPDMRRSALQIAANRPTAAVRMTAERIVQF